ncbi:MAG: hypothetical protein HZA51_15950 [Planctomycetes bacterium]|nr:hypothetical protein [Planctomycetota bacterium]
MHIESGPTTERKIRTTLLLLMVAVFSVWFAYDGFVGWPGQNQKEFLQIIPLDERPKAASGPTYPHITEAEENGAREAMKNAITSSQQRDALVKYFGGPPTYENAEGIHYFGTVHRVMAKLEGGKVAEIVGRRGQRSNYDLLFQKYLSGGLGVLALYLAWFVLRVRGTRLVLDENGLALNGVGPIGWDAMKSMDISRFQKKGWVELVYATDGSDRRLRLDEYHLARFDDIIDEICRRKGFENPLPVKSPATADEGAA